MKIVILLITLLLNTNCYAQDTTWNWFWVQTSPTGPLVFKGNAKTISKKSGEFVFKIDEQEKILNTFTVRLKNKKNKIAATFSPPNTEVGDVTLIGKLQTHNAGESNKMEQIILTDTNSGQLMVFTRFYKVTK
jgi:hypothetical protein